MGSQQAGYFGFQPVAPPLPGQIKTCYISTTSGVAWGVGDPVDLLGTGDTAGFYPEVCLATAGATNPIYGVILGFVPTIDTLYTPYRAASTARYCFVCVDPLMEYEIQAGATVLGATTIGLNAVLKSGSVNAYTGISGWYMDSGDTTAPSANATYQLLIMGAANRPNNDITQAYAVWRVQISLKRGVAPSASLGALGV